MRAGMDLRRLAVRALGHLGLAAAIAAAVTSPARAASSSVTEVSSGYCPPDRREFGWVDSLRDAYEAQPDDGDLQISVAMLLEPQFDGARPFHEPSGFRTLTTSSWDYTNYVADDAITTTVVGKRDAGPHVLAGHALYGMGKQVVVLTAGTVVGELRDWKNDPVQYYASRIPGISAAHQVMTAPSTAAAYREIALTIPAQWQSFLAAPDTEQAQMIGATAVTVGVVVAPLAKGSGSAALDGYLARWTKAQQDLLNLGKKKAPPAVSNAEPVFTPRPHATPAAIATPIAIATPVMSEERAKEWFSKDPPKSRHRDVIPETEIQRLRDEWRFPRKETLTKGDIGEARAIRVDELDGKRIVARTEAQSRKVLGVEKGKPICDHIYEDPDGGLVPVETKNIDTVTFHDDGNSPARKFESIVAADARNHVKRFEVVVNDSSELHGDIFVDPTNGQIWKLVSGSDGEYTPWLVGPRQIPVYLRRSPL